MTESEKLPTNLLTATTELRQLILDNPDLPLLVFAGEDCNSGDYMYMSCSNCRAYKGEVLDCSQKINEEKVYWDRDDFEEDLADFYSDFKGSEEDFNKLVKEKLAEYEPYWRDCIILNVDN